MKMNDQKILVTGLILSALLMAKPTYADMGNIGPAILIIPALYLSSFIVLPILAIWAFRKIKKIKKANEEKNKIEFK